MRRPVLCILVAAAAAFLLQAVAVRAESGPLQDLEKENYRKVVQEIADRVVARLPDDIHFRLLGIPPIQGDDGALVDALTATIKKETRYHLVERQDLDRILEEQGIQLSPIADPRQPVEPGRIQGVEGLLLGKVVKNRCSSLYCSVEVFLKLADVERGSVVFAESFGAYRLPQYTVIGGAALLVAVLLVFLGTSRRKSAALAARGMAAKDDAGLNAVLDELRKARDDLSRAHDDLVAADRTELSTSVRDVQADVKDLIARVERAPGLHAQAATRRNASLAETHTTTMKSLAGRLRDRSEKLQRAAASRDEAGVGKLTEALKEDVREAVSRFQERKPGRV